MLAALALTLSMGSFLAMAAGILTLLATSTPPPAITAAIRGRARRKR